jgi:hypothetical protein
VGGEIVPKIEQETFFAQNTCMEVHYWMNTEMLSAEKVNV